MVTIRNWEWIPVIAEITSSSLDERVVFKSTDDHSWDATIRVKPRSWGQTFKDTPVADFVKAMDNQQGNDDTIETIASCKYDNAGTVRASKTIAIEVDCI
jgi:glucose-6-phosphate isomerase